MQIKKNQGFTIIEFIVTLGLTGIVAYGAITLIINNAKRNKLTEESADTGTSDYLKKEAFIQLGLNASLASDFQSFPVPTGQDCFEKPVPCLRRIIDFTSYRFDPVLTPVASGIDLSHGFQFFSNRSGEIKTKTVESTHLSTQEISSKLSAAEPYIVLDSVNWSGYMFTHPLCDQISTLDCPNGNMPFVIMTKSEKDIALSFDNILASLNKISCEPVEPNSNFKMPKTSVGENYKNIPSMYSDGYTFFKPESLYDSTISTVIADDNQIASLLGKLLLIYDRNDTSKYIVQYIEDIQKCSNGPNDILSNPNCDSLANHVYSNASYFPSNPSLAQVSTHIGGDFIVKLRAVNLGNDNTIDRLINNYMPDLLNFSGLTPVVWRNQARTYMFPTVSFSFYRESTSSPSVLSWYGGSTDMDVVQNYSTAEYCATGEAPSLGAKPITITAYYLRDPEHPNISCNDPVTNCGLYKSIFSSTNQGNGIASTRLGDHEFRITDAQGPFVIARNMRQEDSLLIFQYKGSFNVSTINADLSEL